jgi:predicted amidophosphoribosyltransferase
MYTCPQCDAEINEATEICPHCGTDLTVSTAGGRAARKVPLRSTLVRWVPLLAVLLGAMGFFIWYMLKLRVP